MTTSIELDHELVQVAVELGGHGSEHEAVVTALQEYIQKRAYLQSDGPTPEQLKMKDLFGTIDFDPDYDPRKLRGKV